MYNKIAIKSVISDQLPKLTSNDINDQLFSINMIINSKWKYLNNKEAIEDLQDDLKFWQGNLLTNNNTGEEIFLYAWNKNAQPKFSIALSEIIKNSIKTECFQYGTLMRIALTHLYINDEYLLKLAKDIEAEKKDLKFTLTRLLSWHFFTKANVCNNEAFYFMSYVNLIEYALFKDGPDHNHNVIKLPNSYYLGFDPKFFFIERKEHELEKFMYNKFIDSSYLKPEMKAQHTKFCSTLTFESFKEKRLKYQNEIGYHIFDENKVSDFIRSSF